MARHSVRAVARHSLIALAAAAVLAGGPQPARAQDTELPSGDDVVARYVVAIGGRDAILSRTASRMTARLEVPAMSLEGSLEVLVASPDDMIQRMHVSGMGESMTGLTAGRAWAVDPMQGARLIDGLEAEQLQHTADPTISLRDPVHYSERTVVGMSEYDDEACIEVRFVLHSGRESVDCFSTGTGLLIGSRTTVDGPMGSMDVVVRIADYGVFDGVTLPTDIVQAMMGIEQRIIIDAVEFGAVSTDDVAPPAAIRTLLDG